MARWVPIFFNCPLQIRDLFCNLNIHTEESFNCEIRLNECIIISEWNAVKSTPWFNSIATLRCRGQLNPIILLSFQSNEQLLPLIPLTREGIIFLRLPFHPNDLIFRINTLTSPDVSKLKIEQKQLCFDNICKLWSNLRHGRPNEFINTILIPLRWAITLDANPKEKRKVMEQVLQQNVSIYWHSSLIKSLRDDAEKLIGTSEIQLIIHNFFSELTLLILELEKNSLDNEFDLLKKLDKLIYAFKEIDKYLFNNYGT